MGFAVSKHLYPEVSIRAFYYPFLFERVIDICIKWGDKHTTANRTAWQKSSGEVSGKAGRKIYRVRRRVPDARTIAG
jgi:hypothetical protein